MLLLFNFPCVMKNLLNLRCPWESIAKQVAILKQHEERGSPRYDRVHSISSSFLRARQHYSSVTAAVLMASTATLAWTCQASNQSDCKDLGIPGSHVIARHMCTGKFCHYAPRNEIHIPNGGEMRKKR